VAGPSGVGKGTVIRELRSARPDVAYAVSYTTRPPRPGEVDGDVYRFVSDGEFDALVDQGALLEYASMFGHRYGTVRSVVEDLLATGRSVVKEVDVEGAATIRRKMPEAVLVFLLPPSIDDLVDRLHTRATEDEEEIERRLARARWEMEQAAWFDHVVLNDRPDRAARALAAIIDADPVAP
jgi:guanylate kinase